MSTIQCYPEPLGSKKWSDEGEEEIMNKISSSPYANSQTTIQDKWCSNCVSNTHTDEECCQTQCTKCLGTPGHKWGKDCPHYHICNVCKQGGHFEKNCRNNTGGHEHVKKTYKKVAKFCSNCVNNTHTDEECCQTQCTNTKCLGTPAHKWGKDCPYYHICTVCKQGGHFEKNCRYNTDTQKADKKDTVAQVPFAKVPFAKSSVVSHQQRTFSQIVKTTTATTAKPAVQEPVVQVQTVPVQTVPVQAVPVQAVPVQTVPVQTVQTVQTVQAVQAVQELAVLIQEKNDVADVLLLAINLLVKLNKK